MTGRRELVHRHNYRRLLVPVPRQQLLSQRTLLVMVCMWMQVVVALFQVQLPFLLLQALLLEEQPDVVHGKDDALAVRLLRVNVDATHEHRVGTVE